MRAIAATLAVAALIAACASAPSLPPKASPEEVQVFYSGTGTDPEAGYRVLGPLRVERPMAESDAEVVAHLRADAARMGADAIIVTRVGRSTEGAAGGSTDERKIGEATAIYWPPAE